MTDLARLAAAVADQSGIRLPLERLAEAVDGMAEYPEAFADGEALARRLIDALTVKESYFLRQTEDLRALDWPRLLAQALAAGRSRVRVWSAACAHGEEAYTLAMLASNALPNDAPPVDVLGTDIADSALARAAAGVYGSRAVRHLSPAERERFFRPVTGGLAVGDRLRELTRFKPHNLARDQFPPPDEAPFDLIVCRNVLIYFEPFAIDHFSQKVSRALQPEGRLVLGAADRLCLTQRSLRNLDGLLRGSPPRPFRRAPARKRAEPRRPPRDASAEKARLPRDVTDPALAGALRLADEGNLEEAATVAGTVVEHDPMNAPGQFVRGTVALAAGDAAEAVRSLRAAIYADPGFAAAAFQLGRAHDALGDERAARRAYALALERLEAGTSPYPWLLEAIDAADIAVACAVRLNRS